MNIIKTTSEFKNLFEIDANIHRLVRNIEVHAKTALQEFLQQRGHALPVYRVVETGGEAHSRLFTISCKIDLLDREFTSTASSRRKAEQLVAEQFLATLEVEI